MILIREMQWRTAEVCPADLLVAPVEEFYETEQLHPSVTDIIEIHRKSAGSMNRHDSGFLPVFLPGKSGKSYLFGKRDQGKNGKQK